MNESAPQASRRFSFDTASAWILALTGLVAIVGFIPASSVSLLGTKTTALFIGVLLTFIAFVVARLMRGSIVVPPLTLLGALWLVPLAYLLSTLFSGANPVFSFFGTEFEIDTLGFVLLLAMLATLAALVLRRSKDYQRIYVLLGAGVGIALLVQIGFIVSAKLFPGSVSPVENLVGALSDIGMLSALGLALALLALRFFSFKALSKLVIWVGIIFALFLLAVVNSPLSSILTGIVALGLFIEGLLKKRAPADDSELDGVATPSPDGDTDVAPAGSGILVAPIIVLLVSVFLIIGGSVVANALSGMTGINALDVRPSWQSTFDIGSHTYASSPLFGSGPGTFGEQWLEFRDRTLNDTIFWNIDFQSGIGYIPTSFVTTGAVGVIAWLAFIGFFLFVGLRTLLFRLPKETFLKFVSVSSFTGSAFVLALAFFAVPGPVVLALGFLMLGIFVSSLRYGKDRLEWGLVFSKSPRLGFVIVFALTLLVLASIAAAYVVVERHLANASYGASLAALSAGNTELAATEITQSITLAPTDRAYRLAAAIGIEQMRAIAADTTLPANVAQQNFQNALSSSIAAGAEAVRLQPNDYQNWAVLGNVYQSVASLKIEGAYEQAKVSYERAAALNPTSPVIPYIIAQLEITEGNTALAEERLLASISTKRDYIPAILLLSQLKVQMGQAREALEAAEAAAYLAPNDPSVLFSVGLLRLGTGDMAGATTALARAVELNPQYANARFFLAAIHANQGRTAEALAELRTVAAMSEENAAAVSADLQALEAGRNPFPMTRLRSLGIPQPPVEEPGATPAI